MFGLPFFSKNKKSEEHVFFLFLAGEKIYGVAMDESNRQSHTSLYVEQVDPFLKDAILKIEKIISSCEEELGEQIYLRKTVLFLNSLYISDSGGIREDFRQSIKKIIHELDLENLGYVNFHEAVNVLYSQKESEYTFVEESVYDYSVYKYAKGKLQLNTKIAKAQSVDADVTELKQTVKDSFVIGFFYKPIEQLQSSEIISDTSLYAIFCSVYLKNTGKSVPVEMPVVEKIINPKSELLFPSAPGFGDYRIEEKKEESVKIVSKINFKTLFAFVQIPSLPLYMPVLSVIGFAVISIGIYTFFFHSARIVLETKKESFSAETVFTVGDKNSNEFTHQFNIKTTQETSGEKAIGEQSSGEVTIFNGLFEKRDLPANTKLKTKNGIVFITNSFISVPAATTSANIDAGVIVKSFGKKTMSIRASAIGAEGNIDSGSKLTVDTAKEDDLYALANKNFTGGFKRIVPIYSSEDEKKVEEAILQKLKKEIRTAFSLKHTDNDYLFTDFLQISQGKKKANVEVNEEATEVTMTHEGKAKVYFLSHADLIKKIQDEKLHGKEFVENTFQLTKVKKKEKGKPNEYTALIIGKVQRSIKRDDLAQKISGKTSGSALSILKNVRSITNAQIMTFPLSIPLIPLNTKKIQFVFSN